MDSLGILNPILLAIEAQNTLNQSAYLHLSSLEQNRFRMHNGNGQVRQIIPHAQLTLIPLHNTPEGSILLKVDVKLCRMNGPGGQVLWAIQVLKTQTSIVQNE